MGSGGRRLLYCLMMSRMLEVGSGRGFARGTGTGGSAFAGGGLCRIFTVREEREKVHRKSS